MAEVVAGFAGAVTTLAAARASASAGFTGRHESSHRSELAELDRSPHRYRSTSQSGSEMSFQEEDNFRKRLNASQESLNKYYRSLNAYKDESWFRLPSKIKKRKAVKEMKRAAQDVNQGLRECVDNLSDSEPDSDASSISAESGSPPGSALERERIGNWIRDLESKEDAQYNYNMRQAEEEEEESEEDEYWIRQVEEDEEQQPTSPIYSSLFHKGYTVLRKLEQGPHSTVWLAQEQQSRGYVALKISQAGISNVLLMKQERKILRQLHTPLNADSPDLHPGKSHFLDLLDHVDHYDHNGFHTGIVTKVFAQSLLPFTEAHKQTRIPLHLAKQIAKQLLLGLDYMHQSCGIVHTDMRLANILISLPHHESTSTIDDSDITIKIVGLGYAMKMTRGLYKRRADFAHPARARPYRCPEFILSSELLEAGVDIWSVACVLFELITGNFLFNPMSIANGAGEQSKTDSLHIAQIIDLLGDFPVRVTNSGGRTLPFFDSAGRFRYLDGRKPQAPVNGFLLPMLELDPLSRMAAKELVNHEWLRDVPEAALPIDAEHQLDGTKPAVPDSFPDA
ncbi:kinase-like domain-containing protein [Mycena rebaudengoi]|nr:kinase-like domain-containing protein [Mycena rebaudengoi]